MYKKECGSIVKIPFRLLMTHKDCGDIIAYVKRDGKLTVVFQGKKEELDSLIEGYTVKRSKSSYRGYGV